MMDLSLIDAPGADQLPKQPTQALVAGVRAIAYWRLRAGTQAELPELVEPLIDWALGYLLPGGARAERAAAAAAEPWALRSPPAPRPMAMRCCSPISACW